MTDEHYRAINKAIVLVEDQDVREAARTALHHIFEREKKLRERLEQCKARWEGAADELARLREEVDDTEKHRMDGRGEYVAMGTFQRMAEEKLALKAELDRLREMVKSKVEGKKLLKAENARLREENKRLRGQVVLYRNLGGFGKVEGSS